MKDLYGRTIDYMRISITDRCNLRCRYCMPDGIEWIPMDEILTYEQIETVCRVAVSLGINKFKITGGEPLVRKGCPELIGSIKQIPGVEQVTITTNGILLKEQLDRLILAGVDGVNVSLDTLDAEKFKQITGFDLLDRVEASIQSAVAKGLRVKINTVLQSGVNEDEWKGLMDLAKDQRLDVRFIEMMPIGYGKKSRMISNSDLLKQMKVRYPQMEPDMARHGNGPAVYYQIPGFQDGIGFISAIHGKFCGSCNRIRMTSTGELKACLCYQESVSLRDAVRQGDLEEVKRLIELTISKKPEMHCFEKVDSITESRQMVKIGG